MPRRQKRGVGPSKRGRHKKHSSKETRKWNRMNRDEKPKGDEASET